MPVKVYSNKQNKNDMLSAHFKVGEFVCKGSDVIKIDTELINKLEALRNILNCKSIHINSGYRTPAHDKAVGGSGSGQHTKGKAADIVCYNDQGKISAKNVCCAAEDAGFTGIGYISANSTHLDVRTGAKWWGDETKGNKSISKINGSKSFYDYFGIKKPCACPYAEPAESVKKGSKGNGVKWVQWHLNQKGYPVGKVDGVCGKATAKQIAHFQADHKLIADGICGKLTREELKK